MMFGWRFHNWFCFSVPSFLLTLPSSHLYHLPKCSHPSLKTHGHDIIILALENWLNVHGFLLFKGKVPKILLTFYPENDHPSSLSPCL